MPEQERRDCDRRSPRRPRSHFQAVRTSADIDRMTGDEAILILSSAAATKWDMHFDAVAQVLDRSYPIDSHWVRVGPTCSKERESLSTTRATACTEPPAAGQD